MNCCTINVQYDQTIISLYRCEDQVLHPSPRKFGGMVLGIIMYTIFDQIHINTRTYTQSRLSEVHRLAHVLSLTRYMMRGRRPQRDEEGGVVDHIRGGAERL